MPGVAFPSAGPLGFGSPPSRSVLTHRPSVLCSAKTVYGSSRHASLVTRGPIPGAFRSILCPANGSCAGRNYPPHARGFGQPVPLHLRLALTRKPQTLPSFRVTLLRTCPALRPRWCRSTLALSHRGLLPSAASKASAFPQTCAQGYPRFPAGPQLYTFRGSMTRPARSLHPASHLAACEFATDQPATR